MCVSAYSKHTGRFLTRTLPIAKRVSLYGLLQAGNYISSGYSGEARTLLSTMGNRHRAGIDNYHYVNGELRMLTEREALRLMGFPDDFKIVVSRAQMYKQAGNSIVVDVLMHILQLVLPNLKY